MIKAEDCLKLDNEDVLNDYKNQFYLSKDIIYLDGNSLGALPKRTISIMNEMLLKEWGETLIASWHKHEWLNLPLSVGNKIASLIGASEGEVIVTDSISVNLFKLIYSGLNINAGRKTILTNSNNFPTDLYIAEGMTQLFQQGYELKAVEDEHILSSLSSQIAVLCLSHVDYRSGYIHDIEEITRIAHTYNVLVIYDLAHSAGVIPVHLNKSEVDFAVGCGYKFLNGGPGAPSFIYAAKKHHSKLKNPIPGWMGHCRPLSFETTYHPADGVQQYLCGTPPILSLKALESSLDLLVQINMQHVRAKSIAMTELFIHLIDQEIANVFTLISPRDKEKRASQVSLGHPKAQYYVDELMKHKVITDFRPPHIIRFGFAPLYQSYSEIWQAVQILKKILESQ